MATFFTSDTHWNHQNILKYCNRPFASVDEMNEALIANWNRRVTEEDTVYHLGDFAMGDRKLIPFIRARLRGKIILVRGNHDSSDAKMLSAGINEVCRAVHYTLPGIGSVYMRHIPNNRDHWDDQSRHIVEEPAVASSRADYYLHGHVHNDWRRRGKFINVGVDVQNFEPKTIEELIALPDDASL